jgi:putative endonuclease
MIFRKTGPSTMVDAKPYPNGACAEKMAESYLERQGLILLERNFQCQLGEIDLIMEHGDSLIFVEVRFRKSPFYGSAVETVTRGKQRKIIKAAQYYLLHNKSARHKPLRFDVMGIMPKGFGDYDYDWLQNAFYSDL